MPLAGHALERVDPAIVESKARPGHQILDRAGDEYFTALGERGHARADVHRDASQLVPHDLALASVHAGANLDAEASYALGDRTARPHRARGTVERRQKAVARRVDLAATEAPQFRANRRVVRLNQIAPATVADLRGASRGVDDVGEEDGREQTVGLRDMTDAGHEFLDLVDDSIHVADPREVVDPVQLDVLRARNVLSEVACGFHGDGALAAV